MDADLPSVTSWDHVNSIIEITGIVWIDSKDR